MNKKKRRKSINKITIHLTRTMGCLEKLNPICRIIIKFNLVASELDRLEKHYEDGVSRYYFHMFETRAIESSNNVLSLYPSIIEHRVWGNLKILQNHRE